MTTCKIGILTLSLVTAAASLIAAPASAQVQQTIGSIAVAHGGIGVEARDAMLREQDKYNLRLQFAQQGSGAYLAGVQVKIDDAKGRTVLDTVASGPWFYAQLPAGEYQVTATSEGKSLTQRIAIKTGGWRGWVFRFEPPQNA
jgi:hypothetical protein